MRRKAHDHIGNCCARRTSSMPDGSNSASASVSNERLVCGSKCHVHRLLLHRPLGCHRPAAHTRPRSEAERLLQQGRRADIGDDAVVADHDRRRQHIAQMVMMPNCCRCGSRKAAGLHRAHDCRDRKLGRPHLEQIHAGLEIDRLPPARPGSTAILKRCNAPPITLRSVRISRRRRASDVWRPAAWSHPPGAPPCARRHARGPRPPPRCRPKRRSTSGARDWYIIVCAKATPSS